jgi:EAL domain-containing protein (putative c-di-GMP-specific phosphodiesterase class I)
LLTNIEDILLQTALPADRLELEITENICLSDDGRMLAPLMALRKMGVHLAFDDFGSGYASLSCLTRYPHRRVSMPAASLDRYCCGAPHCASASANLRNGS